MFTGEIPAGMERIGPLQAEVMAAADDLRAAAAGGEEGLSGRGRSSAPAYAAAPVSKIARALHPDSGGSGAEVSP